MDFSPFLFLFIRVPGLWHKLWDLESSMISIEPQALLTIILFKNVTFQVLQIKLFNTSIHPNFVPLFLCQPTGFCIHKILPKKEKKHSGWVLDAFPQRIWEGYNVEIILFIYYVYFIFYPFFKRTFESANSSCKFVVVFRFSASFDPNKWIKIKKSWGMSLPFNSKDLVVNSPLQLLHIAF